MGQTYCNCTQNQTLSPAPKCSLYFQEMLSHYTMPGKQNINLAAIKNVYLSQIKNLPTKYTDLLMYLSSANSKYQDPFFPLENWTISTKSQPQKIKWIRLSDQNLTFELETYQSKFCSVFKFLHQNHPSICQKILPKYDRKMGLAVCFIYINGVKEEVLIDDMLPFWMYRTDLPPEILLLEKAFAKVMGCYQYINAFSMGQIFMEITGIPYYTTNKKLSDVTCAKNKQNWQKIQSNQLINFKDALRFDESIDQPKKYRKDTSIFGNRKGYVISSIKFSTCQFHTSLCKFTIDSTQIISLRVSQLNYKYQDQKNHIHEYPPVFMAVFRQTENGFLECVGQNHIFENCLYLNNIYTQIQTGNYYVYVKPLGQVRNLSLVIYGNSQIKIAQIFDSKKCKQLLGDKFCGKKYMESFCFEELSPNVYVSVHNFGNIIGLFFQDNYPAKKLRLNSNDCFFEAEPERREVGLGGVKHKWILVLVGPSNNKLFHTYFDII